MRVRDASGGDLFDIVRIYNDAIENTTATFDLDPVSVESRQEWYEQFDGDDPLLVAEVEGGVAGYAYYLPYRPKRAYAATKEMTVYVEPLCRGRGVASALYEELIRRAREFGVHVLVAVIADQNEASVALHERFGFERVGCLREVGRKFDRWIETTFYQLILVP